MTIGFIGLGIMGKPMAANLMKAGHSLVVYDVARERMADAMGSGAQPGSSPADVASGARALKVDGKACNDHAGIIQFYEKLAGVTARRGR